MLTDGAKISWKRIASATGYQITISTDKKFKKNVKNYIVEENKNNELIYGLKSGKTYYVKVRAVAQGGGKKVTGKYSKAVKFTTYVVPKVKKISVKNNKKGTITITASKVKGAAGYAFVVTADSIFMILWTSRDPKEYGNCEEPDEGTYLLYTCVCI